MNFDRRSTDTHSEIRKFANCLSNSNQNLSDEHIRYDSANTGHHLTKTTMANNVEITLPTLDTKSTNIHGNGVIGENIDDTEEISETDETGADQVEPRGTVLFDLHSSDLVDAQLSRSLVRSSGGPSIMNGPNRRAADIMLAVTAENCDKGAIINDLPIDQEGMLLLDCMAVRGLIRDQIQAYEVFVCRQIEQIIRQQVISMDDGTYVAFTNLHRILPFLPGYVNSSQILYPQTARAKGITYSMNLRVDLERRRNDTGEVVVANGSPQVIRDVDIGKIPVMLGSSYDNLVVHNISREQLLQMGECPFDTWGYFIVNGVERVIMIQERLRAGRILIYKEKTDVVCKITCLTIRGSTIVKLFINSK